MNTHFSRAFSRLNAAQKKAVESIEGPVMVVAGPGTGKTQVLATRIAHILQETDTQPKSILALTFTESAAANMQKRLVSLTGQAGYQVHVSTFHSFCRMVLEDHPEYFPIERNIQVLSEVEKLTIFEGILHETKLEVLKPLNRPFFYLPEIMSALSTLKRENVTPEDLAELTHQEQQVLAHEEATMTKAQRSRAFKNIQKHTELFEIFSQYQSKLRDQNRLDFDDMISLVVQAFEASEELLLEYQERFLYILVDEYQDTNTAQNRVVELLSSYWGQEANVFVVGDPNQSIFRFQGASLENTTRFLQQYPKAELITLTTGYRCPTAVYDAAHRLISHDASFESVDPRSPNTQLFEAISTRLKRAETPKTLSKNREKQALAHNKRGATHDTPVSTRKKPGTAREKPAVRVFKAASQLSELAFVVQEIDSLIDQGVSPAEIAVLYRHNKDVGQLEELLQRKNIGYRLDTGQNVLEIPEIQQLILFLETMHQVISMGSDGLLYQVLQFEWIPVSSLTAMKLARVASRTRKTMLEVIELGYDRFSQHDTGQPLTALEFSQAAEIVRQFRDWIQLDAQHSFEYWLEYILIDSGYIEWLMTQPSKFRLIGHVQTLLQFAHSLAGENTYLKLADFLKTIQTMREHNLVIPSSTFLVESDKVTLTTAHKAKGQEWRYVFMLHCLDKKWGNNTRRELLPLPDGILTTSSPSQLDRNNDERRLFYVALTRAKTSVTISYPETVISEGRSRSVLPSMFLEEAGLSAPYPATMDEDELQSLLTPTQLSPVLGQSEETYLRHLLSEFSLSITALNTYLRDPDEFLTSILVRVPQAENPHLAFGSAVHSTLEFLHRQLLLQNQLPELGLVTDLFSKTLSKELQFDNSVDRRLEHGLEVLQRYYHELAAQHQANQLPDTVFVERFFGSGSHRTYLDDIPLKGRIDRVDWLDKSKKTVQVVDYKTGKPKTANYIEGKLSSQELSERERALPESIRGPYKRQLLFYKLLADLDPLFTPTVEEGVFMFLEHEKKVLERRFPLLASDIEDLKSLIKQVMREIRSLAFLRAESAATSKQE